VATLAHTRDDALGEVFDKVGKRLGLPFPGGPHVDALAEEATTRLGHEDRASRFAVARCGDTLDFSYSGLKTQMLSAIDRLDRRGVCVDLGVSDDPELLALVVAFREAAVAQIVDRLDRLAAVHRFDRLAVSGGAAANRLLRRRLVAWAEARRVVLDLVPLALSGDNAAMIAHAGLRRHLRGEQDDPRQCDVSSRLPLGAARASGGASALASS
jgi:N6-L-threonylcarbamoyladenine synthase